MARKSNDDSSLMDKIMDRIKGSGEGGPNRTDPSQKKSALFHMVFYRSHAAVLPGFRATWEASRPKRFPIRISSSGLERERWKILSWRRKR